MITKYIIATLTLFTSTALAQTSGTPSPVPSPTTFESSGRVETKMFVPEDLMKGSLHTVGEQAENDGLLNTYFLYGRRRV